MNKSSKQHRTNKDARTSEGSPDRETGVPAYVGVLTNIPTSVQFVGENTNEGKEKPGFFRGDPSLPVLVFSPVPTVHVFVGENTNEGKDARTSEGSPHRETGLRFGGSFASVVSMTKPIIELPARL